MRLRSCMTRRAMIAGAVGGMALPGAVLAQPAGPTPDKLDRMINQASSDRQPIRWANPQIIGFAPGFQSRGFGYKEGPIEYHFAVAVARTDDDLIFFTNEPDAGFFKMHRTGFHLRRVASAYNYSKRAGGLQVWAGPECDADFAAQLDYWARKNI